MRKIGCMIIYNEAPYIGKALNSLSMLVDEVVIVDGPYIDYPHSSVNSDDGTLELLDRFGSERRIKLTVVTKNMAWQSQVEKRNEYLKYCAVGDLLFICDGDWQPVLLDSGEIFKDMSIFGFKGSVVKPDGKGGAVIFRWGNPLIFRKVKGLHYKYNHYSLYDGEGRSIFLPPYKLLDFYEAYQVYHVGELRDADRAKANWDYYGKALEYASGLESDLYCCNCQASVKLSEGELIKCPKCGFGRIQAHVDNKPAS